MTVWGWILLASAVAYVTKLAGYLVPARWLENDHMTRVAGVLTIGLLASLTAINTFSAGQALVIDARVAALVAAAIALWLRAPFLIVVIVGSAATSGGTRRASHTPTDPARRAHDGRLPSGVPTGRQPSTAAALARLARRHAHHGQ